jgi:hypothetical protein
VPRIVSIVEGHGEQAAVPILIRRIGEQLGVSIDGYKTIRTKRGLFPRSSAERERQMRIARDDAGPNGAILVILDSDGEPPCAHARHGAAACLIGDDLLVTIRPIAAGLPVAVVMAEREFEAWFVAAAESLVVEGVLQSGSRSPREPEQLQDPKGWLASRMLGRRVYNPVADQKRLAARFDIGMARANSPSFDAAYREIERLIRAVAGQ